MPHRCHAQKSRVFYNKHTDAKYFNKCQDFTKKYWKEVFHKALAFQSKVDHRTYAQVLTQIPGSNPKGKHYQSVGSNPQLGLSVHSNMVNSSKPMDIQGHSNVVKHKVVGVDRSCFKENAFHSKQRCKPTGHTIDSSTLQSSNHRGLNQDTDHFGIPLYNSFALLADEAHNENNLQLQSCREEVINHACGTEANASERIPERNGQRTPACHVAYTTDEEGLCQEYHRCKEQNGVEFGCVPLSPVRLFTGDPTYWNDIPDIISAHKLIRDSGLPNFLGCRIPVRSQLNVKAWRFHLADYWDQQLVDLIEYGFPLDFDRSSQLGHTLDNHTSALQFSDHVDQYIEDELQHGALLGPFDHKPCSLHVSPFMTREKSNSQLRRTIIDLSWPKGQAVNDGVQKDSYLGTKFEMHYPSVDRIVNKLNEIGPAARIFKVDISRAFRHIRIDPGDIDLLGLHHKGQYYIDLALPFGFRLGSFFFSKLSDRVRYIMKKYGHNALLNYLDDLIYCGLPSTIDQAYDCLIRLLGDLGLDISWKKLHPPSTQAVCLGILFDTINRSISIPPDKLQEIIALCNNWQDKSTCTKANLQSLLGSLLYVSKCVKPARFFLNRMLQVLRDQASNTIIRLTSEFFKDLHWFRTLLKHYNGITFYEVRSISADIYLDASLTGLGGAFGNFVYALQLPKNFHNYNIVHLEILNIVVAFKIWGQAWQNKRVRIYCDNHAVVDALNSGRARDTILATCVRNIWLLAALYNVTLVTSHVQGVHNTVADLLSRWHTTTNNVQKLHNFITEPIWVNVHLDLTLLNYNI